MRWGLRGIVAAAVLYAAAVAYAGGNNAGEHNMARLTLGVPRTTVALQEPSPEQAAALQVRVGAIENPGMTPFGIVIKLADGNEIGRFAVFPADRTGDYFLSLKAEESAVLAAPGAAVTLELDLIGTADDRLNVVVDFVRLK